ncbi:MAG: hypothetical protein IJ299_03070 [Oscillospiraceae bacterium]|nr:hypothetical protein [Oscillospiraceae bacterium]
MLISLVIILTACGGQETQTEVELAVFSSENGYEVSYPDYFSPAALSSEIDFVIMDENTGSSVTVLTEDAALAEDITEESFCEEKLSDGMEIKILSFEQKTLNELPAYEITYKYNESTVIEIVYTASEHIYRATYTELPGTSDNMHNDMIAVISSLCER